MTAKTFEGWTVEMSVLTASNTPAHRKREKKNKKRVIR